MGRNNHPFSRPLFFSAYILPAFRLEIAPGLSGKVEGGAYDEGVIVRYGYG